MTKITNRIKGLFNKYTVLLLLTYFAFGVGFSYAYFAFVKEDTSIKMISNRVTSAAEGHSLYEKMSVVSDKFLNIPITYLGSVPMDEQISKAVMRQKPVSVINPDAPASRAIKQIAEKLLELETEEISDKRGMFQLFSNLIRNRMSKK